MTGWTPAEEDRSNISWENIGNRNELTPLRRQLRSPKMLRACYPFVAGL